MRGLLRTSLAAGGIALAIPGTALAADFLPDRAAYDGQTNHGGNLTFKVRDHKIVLMKGSLPLPPKQTCQYAASRRIPLRLHQSDPVGNGPFKIRATQRVNPGTSKWRRLELRLSGQFDSDAQQGHGTLRVKVFDGEGKCSTRDDLAWHIQRR
jgi:hypothetical protein